MNASIDYKEIQNIVWEAGETAIAAIGDTEIYTKGSADFVTKTDLDIQHLIKNKLYDL